LLAVYRDVAGLAAMRKIFRGKSAMLSGGHIHHVLLQIEVGYLEKSPGGSSVRRYHVGWRVGQEPEALRGTCERMSPLVKRSTVGPALPLASRSTRVILTTMKSGCTSTARASIGERISSGSRQL